MFNRPAPPANMALLRRDSIMDVLRGTEIILETTTPFEAAEVIRGLVQQRQLAPRLTAAFPMGKVTTRWDAAAQFKGFVEGQIAMHQGHSMASDSEMRRLLLETLSSPDHSNSDERADAFFLGVALLLEAPIDEADA